VRAGIASDLGMLANRLGAAGTQSASASKHGDARVPAVQSTAAAYSGTRAIPSKAAPAVILLTCAIADRGTPYHLFQSVAVRAHPAGPRDDMVPSSAQLILGSASPRRRDILASLGIPFIVLHAGIDEQAKSSEEPRAYVERIVLEKLTAVSRAVSEPGRFSGLLVADTIVVLDGEILGKPTDVVHAEALLAKIVGRAHTVITRYAVSVSPRLEEPRLARSVESRVTMRAASPDEVRAYAATGEGLDKAGAYAAQGIGAFLVSRIDGSFTNVVGLPACEVVQDLVALGLLARFPLPGNG
jgi:septum formation protein